MIPAKYSVILVFSTGHAIRLEHVLNQQGIETKLIPVPRYFSSTCGNCVRIKTADTETAAGIIEKNRIEIEDIRELQEY